ncbi:MAG: amino acid permease [Succinivibrionaceae bacterium]|nr:amino acid permease [Succinivibrionaceae bacterium]
MTDPPTDPGGDNRLGPYLNSFTAWGLCLGCGIGWGAFLMPGTTFLPGAGPLGTVIAMMAGCLLMAVVAKNYHALMQDADSAGGAYTYTRTAFGADHGFLCSWFLLLTYINLIWANSTAFSLLFRHVFGDVFQFGFHYRIADYDIYFGEANISVCAIILLGFLCLRRRMSVAANLLLAAGLVAGISFFFFSKSGSAAENIRSFGGFSENGHPVTQILRIVAITPWAYLGFESISNSSEEFVFSRKKAFRIMLMSLLAIMFCYIGLSVFSVSALPPGYGSWYEYISALADLEGTRSVPTFSAAQESFGNTGIVILAVTMLCALSTSVIANTIATSRLLYCMGRDNILPKWFGQLKRKAPLNAIVFIVVLSVFIPFLGRTAIGWHVDLSILGTSIAYGYVSAAALKKAIAKGSLLLKITGCAGILSSLIFAVLMLIPGIIDGASIVTESYFVITVWSIIGFAFFLKIFRKDQSRSYGQSTVVWLALLFLVFLTSLIWLYKSTSSTMQSAIRDITDLYANEVENQRIRLPEEFQERVSEYVLHQQEIVDNAQLVNSIVQMSLIIFALVIMFLVFTTMIGRQKEMEIGRLKAEESNKAKRIFLSNMSHDIRTPMNAIIGYTNIAKQPDTTEKQMRGYLDKISMSCDHLLSLINDILEMSRIESGKFELNVAPCSLIEVMKETEELFATQMMDKGVAFSISAEKISDPWVICDSVRLKRVLLNLVSNAYKFTPKGGKVNVTLSQFARKNDLGSYRITVADTGIGMSKEFANHVFEAFERERTPTVSGIEGTGLGTAITKRFIDLMKGSITVETEKGSGTIFRAEIDFPITSRELAQNAKSTLGEMDFTGKRLLVVDDIRVNREIAALKLKRIGFKVETAEDGLEAVNKITSASEDYYDAVLMDIQMPVMDGLEATRQIRKLEGARGRIPIIALTANAFAEDITREKESGMNNHISKPINVSELKSTMLQVLSENGSKND